MSVGKKFDFCRDAGCHPRPGDTPQIGEFKILNAIAPPRTFVNDVTGYMKRLGVNRTPKLNLYVDGQPAIFVLGDPLCHTRRAQPIVVSKVWNSKILGWGRVRIDSKASKTYNGQKLLEGFYDECKNGWQYWIHTKEMADIFFNRIAGMYQAQEKSILLNSHFPNFSKSIFHEIFHSFEKGDLISGDTFFAEGFAEYFAQQLAAQYEVPLKVFPAYQSVYDAVDKIVKQLELFVREMFNISDSAAIEAEALKICARGFYAEEDLYLRQLLPVFDEKLRTMAPPELQLSKPAIDDALKINWIKFRLKDENKERKDWYINWLKVFGRK